MKLTKTYNHIFITGQIETSLIGLQTEDSGSLYLVKYDSLYSMAVTVPITYCKFNDASLIAGFGHFKLICRGTLVTVYETISLSTVFQYNGFANARLSTFNPLGTYEQSISLTIGESNEKATLYFS